MAGSGSGRGMTYDEIQKAKQLAKQSLKEGEGKRNIYIAFDTDDLDEVNLVRAQAKNENSNLEFNDFSLKKPFDSKDAEYIKRGIRDRIRQCSVTVVYLTAKTASSKWVDWEIRESLSMGKGVVAMYKGNTPPNRIPKAISDNNIPVVPWNHTQLSKTIDQQAENR